MTTTRPLRVLMIEDDANDAELLMRKLRGAGFSVHAQRVERFEDARRAIRERDWDLVLSDHSLPGFRSADILALLREREPVTPLIVVSGAIGELEVVEALHLGAASYVDKASLSRLVPTIERVLDEADLRQEHRIVQRRLELVQAAVESAHDLILILQLQTNGPPEVLYVNEAAERMTGYAAEEIAANGFANLYGDPGDDSAPEQLRAAMERGTEVTAEFLLHHKDGSTRWVETNLRPIATNDRRFVLVSRDITGRKNVEAQLAFLAMHDPLTGLANRSLLEECMEMELAKARRSGLLVAVLLIDFDDFKQINDTFGHAWGDTLLRELAQRLSACVREVDTVARLGGDEFVVVMTGVAAPDIVADTARRILARAREPVLVESQPYAMSVSIGVSLYPTDAREAKGLLKGADEAMYRIKSAGKNAFAFAALSEAAYATAD